MSRNRAPTYVVRRSSCRDLIVVDSSQLKSEEQKKCQKLYQKIETARKNLELHDTQSAPEFQKWFHSKFGKQLSEIRELNHKLSELRDIVSAVQAQCMITRCDPAKAYESIMRLRSKVENLEKKMNQDSDFDSASFRESSKNAEEEFKKAQDEFKEELYRSAFDSFFAQNKRQRPRGKSYEEAFEEFKEEMDASERYDQERSSKKNRKKERNSQQQDEARSNPIDTAQNRLKEKYRVLARRLHPDLNPGMEKKKLELWHQVQQAYEAKDLSRMETLAALSEMYDQSWENIGALSVLKDLYKELVRSLQQLEKRLRLARKDRSWRFIEKSKDIPEIVRLEKQIATELRTEYADLVREERELQFLVDSWSNHRKSRKRQRSNNMSELEMFF